MHHFRRSENETYQQSLRVNLAPCAIQQHREAQRGSHQRPHIKINVEHEPEQQTGQPDADALLTFPRNRDNYDLNEQERQIERGIYYTSPLPDGNRRQIYFSVRMNQQPAYDGSELIVQRNGSAEAQT